MNETVSKFSKRSQTSRKQECHAKVQNLVQVTLGRADRGHGAGPQRRLALDGHRPGKIRQGKSSRPACPAQGQAACWRPGHGQPDCGTECQGRQARSRPEKERGGHVTRHGWHERHEARQGRQEASNGRDER